MNILLRKLFYFFFGERMLIGCTRGFYVKGEVITREDGTMYWIRNNGMPNGIRVYKAIKIK